MRIPERIAREYELHSYVLNETDWSRLEKERMKKRILKILKRDGTLNMQAFPPEYRWDYCSCRLRHGLFKDWDGWEFRSPWMMTFLGLHGEKCPIPRWDGKPVKHLVVLGEQGLGDEILFLSALPELIARYGRDCIEWVGYEKLNPVVARSYGIRTSSRKLLGEITEGDAVMASGDLFQWYRRDKSHFPRKPFLKPDSEKVEKFRDWLSQYGERPKIGISWYSRHGFIDPKDLMTDKEGVYFDLQYRPSKKDVPEPGVPLASPPFDVGNDFESLFAFVAALDSVQSVTQTLVHIAGSIGKDCKAVIPPKNGEVNWYLWYWECRSMGEHGGKWPSLVYPNVTVYGTPESFKKHNPKV